MTDELLFLDDVFVEYIDHMGNDDRIIDAARVSTKRSFGASDATTTRDERINKRIHAQHFTDFDEAHEFATEVIAEEKDKDHGLVNMLLRDRHGSPFEHAVITFKVQAPIFVFREWHRHRIASINEMSGRYTELLPWFYVPATDRPMKQVGKPGAYRFEPADPHVVQLAQGEARKQAASAWRSYKLQLQEGVAKEIAREVLPVNIYSQMYWTANLRSIMNFISLRTKPHENSAVPSFPQHEISLGADKVEAIFAEYFPWVHEAFEKNGRIAP